MSGINREAGSLAHPAGTVFGAFVSGSLADDGVRAEIRGHLAGRITNSSCAD